MSYDYVGKFHYPPEIDHVIDEIDEGGLNEVETVEESDGSIKTNGKRPKSAKANSAVEDLSKGLKKILVNGVEINELTRANEIPNEKKIPEGQSVKFQQKISLIKN